MRNLLNFIQSVISVKKMNDEYYCPVCDSYYKEFKPYTGLYYIKNVLTDHFTPNAICPNCNSKIRHRFVIEFLKSETNILKENIKQLHFAPE